MVTHHFYFSSHSLELFVDDVNLISEKVSQHCVAKQTWEAKTYHIILAAIFCVVKAAFASIILQQRIRIGREKDPNHSCTGHRIRITGGASYLTTLVDHAPS